jgi:hypothetical protein
MDVAALTLLDPRDATGVLYPVNEKEPPSGLLAAGPTRGRELRRHPVGDDNGMFWNSSRNLLREMLACELAFTRMGTDFLRCLAGLLYSLPPIGQPTTHSVRRSPSFEWAFGSR